MAKAKADPVAKIIWSHMRYAESFDPCGMYTADGELFWDRQGNRITQKEMQAKCEKHMQSTVKRIRKLLGKLE